MGGWLSFYLSAEEQSMKSFIKKLVVIALLAVTLGSAGCGWTLQHGTAGIPVRVWVADQFEQKFPQPRHQGPLDFVFFDVSR